MSIQNTLNYLQSNRAVLTFGALPEISYTIQNFNLPGLNLPYIETPSPINRIKMPGSKIEFEELSIGFLVQEDLKNWIEIYNWLTSVAPFTDLCGTRKVDFTQSDASIIVYSSKNNPIFSINFADCIPTSLGEIEFTEMDSESIMKLCTATFSYSYYTISNN